MTSYDSKGFVRQYGPLS